MALSWTSGLLEKFCMTSAGDRSTWAGGFGGPGRLAVHRSTR